MPIRTPFSMLALRAIAISLILTGCQSDADSDATDAIAGYASQPVWAAAAFPQPVLSAGDEREEGMWNDPSVLKVGDEYIMYLSTSVEEPFVPPILPFRAVSKNGIDWTLSPKEPLLSAEKTPFDNNETPNVIRFNGQYHMYYTGVYPPGDIPSMAIGHAVSDDGINWVNDNRAVLEATGDHLDWNGYLVAEPGAVVFNDTVYLYFTAMGTRPGGNPPQLQHIGLATSTDGRTFGEQQKILGQSATYPPEKGFVGYSTPAAIVHDGNIHLVYDIAAYGEHNEPQWAQLAIHHAVSSDGINFKEDALPMLTRKDFSWTSGEIIGPTLLIDDDKVKLWFHGHVSYEELAPFIRRGMKGPEYGIGYAEIGLEDFLND